MECRENIAIIGFFTSYNLETARIIKDGLDDYHFLDSNQFLEYNITYPLNTVVEFYGKEYFMKCEAQAYRELAGYEKAVIGASATALLNPDNIRRLKETANIVWLRAAPEFTMRRLVQDPENYLKEYLLENYLKINDLLYNSKEPIYDIIVDIDRITPVRAADKAQEKLYLYYAGLEAVNK